jgi:hypothetical protein
MRTISGSPDSAGTMTVTQLDHRASRSMKASQTLLVLLAFWLPSQLLAADSVPTQVLQWGADIGGRPGGVPSAAGYTGVAMVAGHATSGIVAIAAGDSHALALMSDGTVAGWGGNSAGQATGHTTPFPHNTNGIVRMHDRVLDNVTAISAGRGFSLALRKDGTVVAWGDSQYGASDVPPGLSNVVAVTAGWTDSLALRRDGTVVGWGNPKPPSGLSNIVAVAAAREWYGHNLALRNDGTVVEWGPNGLERSVAGLSNMIAISAGAAHCLALRRDGTVVEWQPGRAEPGDVAGLSNVAAIAAGAEGASLALKHDGTVAGWGGLRRPVALPAGLTNVLSIAAGENFYLAITTNVSALNLKK